MAKAKSRLTHAQRCHIEAHLSNGTCQTAIARIIGVHQSTISREIERNTERTVNILPILRNACAMCASAPS